MMSYVGLNPTGPVAPNNVSFGDALRRAGLNPVEVTLGLPYMFFAPAGCDPDMQGVQVLIKGLQYTLNRIGYNLATDGHLGPDTAAALNRLSPPSGSYASKPWFQIYGDVLSKIAAGARAVSSRVVRVSALGASDDDGSDDVNFNQIAAQTNIAAAQGVIGAQTSIASQAPDPGTYVYTPATAPSTPADTAAAAAAAVCNVWDFACQAQKLAAAKKPSPVSPVLIAGGVLLGLLLITNKKKGNRR